MTKKEKLNKINSIADRFINASNHGGNNNWWYPKKDVIAYNIKLSSLGFSYDDIKDKISDKQKGFYKNINDNMEQYYYHTLEHALEYFIEDLKENYSFVNECYQAGRSGGWLEVEYRNELGELHDSVEDFERYESYELDYIYKEMIALDKEEIAISNKVAQAKKNLEKYLNSDEFINDFIDTLMTDDDISDYYKAEAKRLIDKI